MSVPRALDGLLFSTGALRVSPPEKPFWYTSGMIGPFYINTHFLYGSETKAAALLETIDRSLADRDGCPAAILAETDANYAADPTYRATIDALAARVASDPALSACDLISGGERRDWFFSLQLAKLLGKPHAAIYKDGAMKLTGGAGAAPGLEGREVLHVSDLVNEASSYLKTWIPALRREGAILRRSLTVVDRAQGGTELLASEGVALGSMIRADEAFFRAARDEGRIGEGQLELVLGYLKDPHGSMRAFLKSHPDFLAASLAADPKTAKRARLCVDEDLYGLR
jgi:orotate phosphoribosyltransferase